ncbi:MAG: serine hydrolase [Acidimicrobiia bacterium]|nr:serine hydrolase [Acidimicrobiia bacterium]
MTESSETTSIPAGAAVPLTEFIDFRDAGFSEDQIGEASDVAERANSNCLLIVRDGRIVHEEYNRGTNTATNQEVFSATKTVTALLVGIAQDRGLLSIGDPVSAYIDEWVGTPSEDVTIRDLLTNASGRYHDIPSDYISLIDAADRSDFAMSLDQQHEPGTVWAYNNAAIQNLETVLQRATGTDVGGFANEALFSRLGMDAVFGRDEVGNPTRFFGLDAGCRDMAAFGQLLLDDGLWGDERIVSGDFVDEMTTPGTSLNAVYGYLTWLNAADGWTHPSPSVDTSGAAWPSAPPDAFAAMGFGQQVVLVMPSSDTVVVRLGPLDELPPEFASNFSIVDKLAGALH